MHGQHVRSGMLCATTGHIHMPAPTLRPCTGRRASTTAQASQQQQQQQQPQPVRSFGEMMQQYKSIAPAAPSSPTKSNQGSTASKDTKGAPRLKPSRQTSAPPDSSSGKRKPAAAASRDGRGAAGAAAAGRPGGPGAKSKGTAASSRIVVNRGSDTPCSTKRSSDTSSSSTKRSSDTSSSAKLPPVINSGWRLPSNGKGFGSIPSQPTQAPGGPNLVQVFRFGVEAAAVCQVIEACGWQTRVALTDSIKDADIMLAAKCSPSGKHRNLAQGKKAAANAGIPFIVVGRKLSVETFRQALIPHVDPNSKEAAALAAASAEAAKKDAANKEVADAFFRSTASWGKGVA